MTRNDLETALKTLPDVKQVDVVGDGTLIATVVSGSFAGKDEAERQAAVWELLRSRYPGSLQNIEFIFTNAPGEDDKPAE